MEKLEIELVTLSKLYPNDAVFALEVRKIVNRIQLKNIQKESVAMENLKKMMDDARPSK